MNYISLGFFYLILNSLFSDIRNKCVAHDDQKYYANKDLLKKSFPLTFDELIVLLTESYEIINYYNLAFSGIPILPVASNATDVTNLLEIMKIHHLQEIERRKVHLRGMGLVENTKGIISEDNL